MDKAKILVIDDDPICTGMLLAILGDDYQVLSANSGSGALDLLSSVKPNLILLDITMPNINGYQVIKHLKGDLRTSNIPVVVISSLVEKSDQDFAINLGADNYLTKPILPNDIQAILNKYLSL
ncbi:response regulator [Shewanella aestuarii]|uniref:Response regulator n=1 Tax=Shewanella aestuarii TaxID=1028752 RepID=A0A6G9QG28_9GAMM|nr:response regulator [Shewanella aestuarii]QIR13426.1 response regulator [Shewanella aestuarii]